MGSPSDGNREDSHKPKGTSENPHVPYLRGKYVDIPDHPYQNDGQRNPKVDLGRMKPSPIGSLMTQKCRAFTLPSLLALLTGCDILGPGGDDPENTREDQTTVLFMGSSYTAFNNVPDRFRDLSEKAGHKVFVRYHLALGRPLSYFAQSPDADEAIRDLEWDFIVLQGGSQSAAYPTPGGRSDFHALTELKRKATEDSPGTRVVYMMPWAYEDGMTWMEDRTETYEEMQLDIREKTLDWAHELELVLAPVGMAFYEVLTTWDHGLHFLHDSDWNHASKEGSFLAAATFFSTIWAEDAEGVDYSWELEMDLAEDLITLLPPRASPGDPFGYRP